jgi:nucleolar protein 16
LTLSQNYKRLGLSSKLEGATGGVEKRGKENEQPTSDQFAIPSDRKTGKLLPEEVQVERDPETGKILRVIRAEPAKDHLDNPLNDPLNEITDLDTVAANQNPNGVIAELEQEAAEEAERLAKKRPRQQSQREEEWITRLVEKHGDNVRAMVKDRKLNPMQQTEGDISRRLKRWKNSKAAD